MLTSLKGSWCLILGASSGMGRATALAMAKEGANIFGVHFGTAAQQEEADELVAELRATGVQVSFHNCNAASKQTRAELVPVLKELAGPEGVRVLLHSLAFGSLLPFLPQEGQEDVITPRQMDMTVDVMGHSLVYWVRDLYVAGLLPRGAKVFALTSRGDGRVMPSYGAVSAAKSALASHVRQLAVELAPSGVSVNALRAGLTLTPALLRIPGSEGLARYATDSNPHGRLTVPEDVAEAVVMLSATDSSWMTGNVIDVDGGEGLV
ncbi:3-oxoacyl-ACP reductase [Streptomyces sp. WM6373]|uniref:SDR family oxidoreductase n=1 Tax=Streptomyces TaxID=1883 RepID=UPI0003C9C264|nr:MULTISPECIES: SDR family oxidoreductase [unclassified Streptomyces]AGZ94586.1 3-oxoacyl-ACP reductase [Streptomyces sp. XY66]KOU43045.1 3-oxoacyl-ACP reductase [Streptomyces sp. WM6373]KOU65862.1 3-oxoacyl-ACP reductase [Streptomyces sp. IGB124]KOU71683.1 3-oxoacyl-ACP reductase [Streptomyces sp. XY66]KOU83095.1 3-oxoacyl-ACP reductase [Streptomyces sp. XY58]